MMGRDLITTYGIDVAQVIGVAYTYSPSLMMRRYLTRNLSAYHSAKQKQFSYFFKGDRFSVLGSDEPLMLRTDPVNGDLAQHWPEPELAVLLGDNHEIIAYTLANDLTAIGIETRGRTEFEDNTYIGKVWPGSGSVGPRFVPASMIGHPDQLTIGLSITRRGRLIFDQHYGTDRRSCSFDSIPAAIVNCYRQFKEYVPLSKQIYVSSSGFLPAGTVIMLGTGLIVKKQYYCEPGDILTVYCPHIGQLSNTVISSST
jgi:2-dehydro-3-deoxy-D-arabinonate dehydratase